MIYGVVTHESVNPIKGNFFGSFQRTDVTYKLSDVKILPPCEPSKIVAIGRNYREHAAEFGHSVPSEPLLFLKPSTAVIGTNESIVLPKISTRVDYEGEVGVVIKKRAFKIPDREDPLDYVLGYTCVIDVTARDLQQKDVQFTRAKSFDTFAPVGPWIETDLDPEDMKLQTRINGDVRQSASTEQLIFPIRFLIKYISNVMTLLPGDIISTGTPSGVGPLKPNDIIEVEVDGLGTLVNRVVAEE